MKRWLLTLTIVIILVTGGCTAAPTEEPGTTGPRTLRIMTYDSFSVSEEVIRQFEEINNVTVQFLQAGDAGTMLNQAILSRDNPQADVLYGIDNTFLSRALEADIFEPYQAKALNNIPEALRLDAQYRVVPTDYGDVCLNYDIQALTEAKLPVPQSLQDLTQPEYKGLLVVENPASSSPGLAFLMATIGVFGEDGDYTYLDFWQALRDNDVLVVDGWDSAYYSEFSGGAYSEGTRPLVVSYATSPAAEVYFSEEPLEVPPTGAVTAPQTCFRQIEFAGILKNGQNRDLAEAFIEYLLSTDFQEDIPLQMWVYPSNPEAKLPQVFTDFALEAEDPVTVLAEAIEQKREAWIEAWTETVLK
ncbi:MAG: thiamine ABC transporter substrate-binding protein [Anaerolineae bacterium]|nr:thiamine ABC transporter substrate-binding protein [Anaerolineae bacterium]